MEWIRNVQRIVQRRRPRTCCPRKNEWHTPLRFVHARRRYVKITTALFSVFSWDLNNCAAKKGWENASMRNKRSMIETWRHFPSILCSTWQYVTNRGWTHVYFSSMTWVASAIHSFTLSVGRLRQLWTLLPLRINKICHKCPSFC